VERSSLSVEKRAGGVRPPAHHIVVTGYSRHPFRVCVAPGTTRSAHPPFPLPCGNDTPSSASDRGRWGRGFASSYLGHSHQSVAFETPADSPAPDTPPAATLLARLFLSFTTAVTLAGRSGVLAHPACPGLPPRHSFQSHRGTDFGRQNTEAPPYPPGSSLADSACVSAVVHWQGLEAPFIVELFAVCFSRQNPGACQAPVPRCHHREAPDASVRSSNLSSLAPDWPCGWGPMPAGGLAMAFAFAHPLGTGPTDGIAATGVSRSPAFAAVHGIESEDYSAGKAGLLSKASLERGGHLSMHHALRDADMTVGKTVPCAWW
jgi:hypothetical protein